MSVRNTRVATRSLLAALGMIAGGFAPANAADLGGNCCADLEERIAELEATTARKGNRKVSLTISGWVNEALFFWNDGTSSDVYVGTNDLERSRFKFAGRAKIDDAWSAGYTLEIGLRGNNSGRFNQTSDAQTNALDLRKSSWFVENKNLGKVTVGQDGASTYHLLDDADGTNTRNYSDAEAASAAMGQFQLRSGGAPVGAGVTWPQVLRGFNNSTPGQNGRRNIVRYDTPVFQGFSASASWGEDDFWDSSLTYKNDELGDFKVLAKAGYGEGGDITQTACHSGAKHLECQWWGIAGTVMHAPTGLYVYGAYGNQHDNRGTDPALVTPVEETDTMWLIQAGIEQKFFPLGKTTLFGEYRQDEAGTPISKRDPGPGAYVVSTDVNFWGAGVVQNVDAAAMDLYVIYRHADGEITNDVGTKIGLDNFDMVITGARIQF
jgi:predicted porin